MTTLVVVAVVVVVEVAVSVCVAVVVVVEVAVVVAARLVLLAVSSFPASDALLDELSSEVLTATPVSRWTGSR